MRVVATQLGQYDQILRDVGEVFDLLDGPDGSIPAAKVWVPTKMADGKDHPIDGELVVVTDAEGNPVHRDFAEDMGDQVIEAGPMRGEVARLGWMRRVPDDTPCGMYPPGTNFWPEERTAAAARRNAPRNSAPAAAIRGSTSRPKFDRPPA